MRKIYIICIVCILFTLLQACKNNVKNDTIEEGVDNTKQGNHAILVNDSTGHSVTLQNSPKKVFSLSASMSEIWLLAGGELSGVTSDAISERDMGIPDDILVVGTVKDPNLEIIISEAPDFVILAEDINSHIEIAETLKKVDIPYYTAKVETVEDYLFTLLNFTKITGDKDAYHKNGTEVKKSVEDLLAELPTLDLSEEKTALFLRAYSTGVKAKADDHTVCYILKDIGVKNIAENNSSMLEDLSMEAIIEADPDFIFIVTMGDSNKAMDSIKESLMSNPAWNELEAVKKGNMLILPKELYHYKPNSRWGEAYENILKIVYPELFPNE